MCHRFFLFVRQKLLNRFFFPTQLVSVSDISTKCRHPYEKTRFTEKTQFFKFVYLAYERYKLVYPLLATEFGMGIRVSMFSSTCSKKADHENTNHIDAYKRCVKHSSFALIFYCLIYYH